MDDTQVEATGDLADTLEPVAAPDPEPDRTEGEDA
jgi:hypothetical protein